MVSSSSAWVERVQAHARAPLSSGDLAAVFSWCHAQGVKPDKVRAKKFHDWLQYKAALDGVREPEDLPVLQPESGGVIVLLGVREKPEGCW